RRKGVPMSRDRMCARDATGNPAAISNRDALRVLRFVSDAEELGGEDPFPEAVLKQLGTLIPAEWIGYEERDFVGKRCLVQYAHPAARSRASSIQRPPVAGTRKTPFAGTT